MKRRTPKAVQLALVRYYHLSEIAAGLRVALDTERKIIMENRGGETEELIAVIRKVERYVSATEAHMRLTVRRKTEAE